MIDNEQIILFWFDLVVSGSKWHGVTLRDLWHVLWLLDFFLLSFSPPLWSVGLSHLTWIKQAGDVNKQNHSIQTVRVVPFILPLHPQHIEIRWQYWCVFSKSVFYAHTHTHTHIYIYYMCSSNVLDRYIQCTYLTESNNQNVCTFCERHIITSESCMTVFIGSLWFLTMSAKPLKH